MRDALDAIAREQRIAEFARYDTDVIREAIRLARTRDEVDALVLALERELVHGEWQQWLLHLFPDYCRYGFAPHHELFWQHMWGVRLGEPWPSLLNAWARGGAKSTSMELSAVNVGARRVRRYGLYVCGTQRQADDHVQSIQTMLESPKVARLYPALAAAEVTEYGHRKGWRRNRLRTAAGFTIDAVGLDVAIRGVKIDADRPDIVWLDDVDDSKDSSTIVEHKIEQLQYSILPTGDESLMVVGGQNIIHSESVFARLFHMASVEPEFLHAAVRNGPIPALRDATIEATGHAEQPHRIVAGTPTWVGQDVARCQKMIDDFGVSAFRVEAQHEVERGVDSLFREVEFVHCEPHEVPDLLRTHVAVDPAVTDTDDSDSQGCIASGIDKRGTIYRLRAWEKRSSPETAIELAITWAYELGAGVVTIETDQGGDTWRSVWREALRAVLDAHPEWRGRRAPRRRSRKAGQGFGPKVHRASQMLADYEVAAPAGTPGRIVHVLGDHDLLERAMRRFPKHKPFDLVDAAYWDWEYLRGRGPQRGSTAAGRGQV